MTRNCRPTSSSVRLYPSSRVELGFGVRLGHAFLRHNIDGSALTISALACELVPRISFAWRGDIELRVAPLVLGGWYARTWMFTGGPELGAALRF